MRNLLQKMKPVLLGFTECFPVPGTLKCELCHSEFICGAPGKCWCSPIKLEPKKRLLLSAVANGCVCGNALKSCLWYEYPTMKCPFLYGKPRLLTVRGIRHCIYSWGCSGSHFPPQLLCPCRGYCRPRTWTIPVPSYLTCHSLEFNGKISSCSWLPGILCSLHPIDATLPHQLPLHESG